MSKQPYHNEASQADRYAVLVNDKRTQKNTFLSHTHPEEEMGGRYAAEAKHTIVGQSPIPVYPAGAAWTRETLPPEPPTNYRIDDMEACGTEAEIRASLGEVEIPDLASDEDTKSHLPLRSSSSNSSAGAPSAVGSDASSEAPSLSSVARRNKFRRV